MVLVSRSQPLTPAGVRGWLRQITFVYGGTCYCKHNHCPQARTLPTQFSMFNTRKLGSYSRLTFTSLFFTCPA